MPMNETHISAIPELISFVRRHAKQSFPHDPPIERRSEDRKLLITPALVQAVSHRLTPLGEPLEAVTRDLSINGLGLIFEKKPPHELYAVRFEVDEHECCLLTMVTWCNAMGPFEFVGLDILRRLDKMPSR